MALSLPKGWTRVELGDVVTERKEKVTPAADDTRPYVALEHIATGEPTLLGHDSASAATSSKTVFEAGDVLFGKLRPKLRKCVRVGFSGVCSTDIVVLYASNGLVPEYLAHLM